MVSASLSTGRSGALLEASLVGFFETCAPYD